MGDGNSSWDNSGQQRMQGGNGYGATDKNSWPKQRAATINAADPHPNVEAASKRGIVSDDQQTQ